MEARRKKENKQIEIFNTQKTKLSQTAANAAIYMHKTSLSLSLFFSCSNFSSSNG
jgi:hypothetical protein